MSGSTSTSTFDPTDFSSFLKTDNAGTNTPVPVSSSVTPAQHDATDFSQFLDEKDKKTKSIPTDTYTQAVTKNPAISRTQGRLAYDEDNNLLGEIQDDGSLAHAEDTRPQAGTVRTAVVGALSGLPVVGDDIARLANQHDAGANDVGHVNTRGAEYQLARGASEGASLVGTMGGAGARTVGELASPLIARLAARSPTLGKIAGGVTNALTDTSARTAASAATGQAAANLATGSEYAPQNSTARTALGIGAGIVGGSLPSIGEAAVRSGARNVTALRNAIGKGQHEDVSIPGTTTDVNGEQITSPETRNMQSSTVDRAARFVQDQLPERELQTFQNPPAHPLNAVPGEHVTTDQVYSGLTGEQSPALQTLRNQMGGTEQGSTLLDSIENQNNAARQHVINNLGENARTEFNNLAADSNTPDILPEQAVERNIANQQKNIDSVRAFNGNNLSRRQQMIADALPVERTPQDRGQSLQDALNSEYENRRQAAGQAIEAAAGSNDTTPITISRAQAYADSILHPNDGTDRLVAPMHSTPVRQIMRQVNNLPQHVSVADLRQLLTNISSTRNSVQGRLRTGNAQLNDMSALSNLTHHLTAGLDGQTDEALDRTYTRSGIGREAQRIGMQNVANGTVGTNQAAHVPQEVLDSIRQGTAPKPGTGTGTALTAARKQYAQVMRDYGEGIGGTIRNTAPENIAGLPDSIFNGPRGMSRLSVLRQLMPEETADHLATEQVLTQLRDKGILGTDGQLDLKKLNTPTNQKLVNRFHQLPLFARDQPLGKLKNLQEQFDQVVADHADRTQQLRDSLASQLIGGDLNARMSTVLGRGAPDAVTRDRLNTIISQVGKDPQALAAVKMSALDHLFTRVTKNGSVDRAELDKMLTAMRTGRGSNPLRTLLGGQGLQRLNQVSASLARNSKAKKGTSNIFQRNTQNPVNWKENQRAESSSHSAAPDLVLFNLFEHGLEGAHGSMHGLLSSVAHAGKIGILMHGAKKGISALHRKVIGKLLSSAHQTRVQDLHDLMMAAVIHPDVMHMLATRVPATGVTPMQWNKLANALTQLGTYNMVNKPASKGDK